MSDKPSSTSPLGSIGFWFFFTFFLSALQGWVLLLVNFFGFGHVEPVRMLTDGSVIFFANALAMKAIEDKCGFMVDLIRKKDPRVFDFIFVFFRRLGAGVIVLVVSVVLYCMLLWGGVGGKDQLKDDKKIGQMEAVEGGLLLISLSISLYEAIDNHRERAKSGGGGIALPSSPSSGGGA